MTPRLCFVGPTLGRNVGWVTSQGEVLADLFKAEGWSVRDTSRQVNRLVRLADVIVCLLRWHRSTDVVILSVYSGLGFLFSDITSLLMRLLKVPTIMVLHGGNLPTFQSDHPTWFRRVLRRAALVVAPSPYLAQLGDRRCRIAIIPNVVDTSAYPFRQRSELQPRLLWMRTFHPLYNPDLAIRVAALLRNRWPCLTLTMAGQDQGLMRSLEASAEEALGCDSAEFPGFLDMSGKRKALAAHDIYLHTSRVDNTPVSVLEALMAGLPVVATAVGGMPDLLEDEQTALLVPDDDEEAMAAAVERLLTDQQLAGKLSRNGRLLAESSSWEAVLPKWKHAFNSILAGRIVD